MGLFDGPVDSSFGTLQTTSGVPSQSNSANEGGFNLGHVVDGLFSLAGQTLPSYFNAQAAKSAAKAAIPAAGTLLLIGGVVLAVVLLRKR